MTAQAAKPRRNPLARFTDQQLRDELDRRAKDEGKPKTVWVEKRSEYLTKSADEMQLKLDELQEDLMPSGSGRFVQIARIRALRDQIKKSRAFAKLAKADEDAAEAQTQSKTDPSASE